MFKDIYWKIGKTVTQIRTFTWGGVEKVPKVYELLAVVWENANKIFEIRVHEGILTAILRGIVISSIALARCQGSASG